MYTTPCADAGHDTAGRLTATIFEHHRFRRDASELSYFPSSFILFTRMFPTPHKCTFTCISSRYPDSLHYPLGNSSTIPAPTSGAGSSALQVPHCVIWRAREPARRTSYRTDPWIDPARTELVELVRIFFCVVSLSLAALVGEELLLL
jgi:hypothetical protein